MLTANMFSDYFTFIVGAFLVAGVLVARFSSKLGLPSLILFISLGMVMGPDGLGLLNVSNVELAQLIGIISLVIILFEGGLHTDWTTIRPVMKTAISLATLTVFLTSAILSLFTYFILDLSIIEAFLLGALVGSTDAAAVFATLKGRNINKRLGSAMEGEAGVNDPMAVFLTLSAIQLLASQHNNIWFMIGSFFWQMLAGVAIGVIIGRIASLCINHINMDTGGMYPIFTLSTAFLTYGAAQFSQASGFLAVYVCALVIGNQDLTNRYTISRFHEGLAWIGQITMFVILGLLVYPHEIFSWQVVWTGLLLSVCLMFIARPIAVFLSTIKMGYTIREKLFLSWAGLRGAVPIVLATYPIVAGVENSSVYFNIVFFIVLTSALLQGASISWVAEKLSLTGEKKKFPYHSLELLTIGNADAKLVEFHVTEKTTMKGKKIKELPLPGDTAVNALVRDGDVTPITDDTMIEEGDLLYILVSNKHKEELKVMLGTKKEKTRKEEKAEAR
ncbi:potassium/proton antiporter [Alteribacillus iranensis]|uniref:Cell volume regulation protein A n=1 Tax=Alteribacillus iranensis TaxID=930128 RepID=A0A1I2ECM3_9BACI|nr:potassium/proton antiporter [Alteribacillus iranensis]SFE90000.1 cell volume regulation protein A [Alteribacillus iranensis]